MFGGFVKVKSISGTIFVLKWDDFKLEFELQLIKWKTSEIFKLAIE